jgi:hypothetical protein
VSQTATASTSMGLPPVVVVLVSPIWRNISHFICDASPISLSYFDESSFILDLKILTPWLVRKGHGWKYIMVVRIFGVLVVFENSIEIVHSFSCQEAKIIDQTSNTASCVCASREPNQNNFVALTPICSNKTISFSDILNILAKGFEF